MSTCTPGQAVVDGLVAEGVKTVFGLPGGHILGIYDAIYACDELRHVLVRHEHAAAAMAAGQAQLTGRPGVCMVTAGPGATNLVTAVAEAHVGALPMIILAARAVTANAHRGASQEIATTEMFAPVTKWAVRVDRPEHLPEILQQAFRIATSGRPGPVYIDIPKDMLDGEIEAAPYAPARSSRRLPGDPELVAEAARMLASAQRPLIVAGGGTVASGASAELQAVAERAVTPVLTSLSGRGSLPDDHPLAAGGLGAHRNALSARLLEEADLVIGLGTRFEEMETNWRPGYVPAPGVPIIQVDLSGSEFGRSVPTTLGIVGDIATVLGQLLDRLDADGISTEVTLDDHPRVAELAAGRELVAEELAASRSEAGDGVNPLDVVMRARAVYPRETTLVVDVGNLAQAMGGSSACFPIYETRSAIVCTSFYGMGFAAAAAPAARIVYPDRPALCFVGDGSFQMVMSGLASAAENQLGVTWCVLNDGALGSIRELQDYRWGGRFIATDFEISPDFAAIARASGCAGLTVADGGEIDAALREALEANRRGVPAVLDCRVFPLRLQASLEHFNLRRVAEAA